MALSSAQKRCPNCGCALMPVPTAVPPCASCSSRGRVASSRASPFSIWVRQPDSSCDSVTGMASIRCVRPVLTMPLTSTSLALSTSTRWIRAGTSASRSASTALTCTAVGIASLLLCPMLTWSFGCTAAPRLPVASAAMTSLAFMLVLVPEPVWNTSIGKCASCLPAATSVAAASMAWATFGSSSCSAVLARAAAILMRPRAAMKARGSFTPLMGKFSTARCVWAPHRASLGTFSSPMLSCSTRKELVMHHSAKWVTPGRPTVCVMMQILALQGPKLRMSGSANEPLSALDALAPVDGRYRAATAPLRGLLSEAGLIRERIRIEAEWLLHLAAAAPQLPGAALSAAVRARAAALARDSDAAAPAAVKAIEARINHDVKAVEYYVRGALKEAGATPATLELVHFGCTSEDINNLSYARLLAAARVLLQQTLSARIGELTQLAHRYADTAMPARTHGQSASPTTLGKECANFAARLKRGERRWAQVAIL